jgi:hypothetical protein
LPPYSPSISLAKACAERSIRCCGDERADP